MSILVTPGLFECFGQNQGSSESQCFLNEGATGHQSVLGVLGGQVPRLYGGTIFGGVQHPQGIWQASSLKVPFFKIFVDFFLPPKFQNFDP